MSNWLVDKLIPSIMRSEVKKSSVPEGLWHKCPSCDAVLYRPELEKTLDVCPKCNHHMRIGARARIDIFLDADGRSELGADLEPVDRLKFRDGKKYKDRLTAAQKQTGEKDALISVSGKLLGREVLDMVAQPVEITGEVKREGDQLYLRAEPDTYRRLQK